MVIKDSLKLFATEERCALKDYNFSPEGPDSTGMQCGGKAQVFLERNGTPDRLLIFGGGHVGARLVKAVENLDFRVTVIDERQEILEKFMAAVETIRSDSAYDKDFPKLDHHSYVVIVTSSHASDMKILEKVITQDCAYVGMIGSKKKVGMIFSALKEKGIDEDLFKKVRAPIGLSIGAEGPEEIAISIAAELIKMKRQRS
jgi:xanthine dehydrogenase accessory factor